MRAGSAERRRLTSRGLPRVVLFSLVAAVTMTAQGDPTRDPASDRKSPDPSADKPADPPQPKSAVDALPPDANLPPLPTLSTPKRAIASAEDTEQLTRLLARLTSSKADIREAARLELTKVDRALLGAIYARIQEIRESIDRNAAPRVIESARKSAKRAKKGKADDGDPEEDDWLIFVQAQPDPESESWKHVVELLGMIRMLSAIGETQAVFQLIELRGNFGEMLRIDLSRQVTKLGDKAVPALLLATRHDAVVVQRFAELELDRLGKVTPGEAVGSSDLEVLSETLRAFGTIKSVDAVDVLLSFANHDRRKVREAARAAIVSIGEAGRFRLRDAYQELTGDKIDKSLSWEILAKRIFFLYDQARSADIVALFEEGLSAQKAGHFEEATKQFDKVLAEDPLFEKRAEMYTSFLEVGRKTGLDQAEERLALLRKARRLGPEDEKIVDAEIAFTEGQLLLSEGRPDRTLFLRAIELDPEHAGAKEALSSLDEGRTTGKSLLLTQPPRFAIGGFILGGSVLLAGFVAFFKGRRKGPRQSPGATPDDKKPNPNAGPGEGGPREGSSGGAG